MGAERIPGVEFEERHPIRLRMVGRLSNDPQGSAPTGRWR